MLDAGAASVQHRGQENCKGRHANLENMRFNAKGKYGQINHAKRSRRKASEIKCKHQNDFKLAKDVGRCDHQCPTLEVVNHSVQQLSLGFERDACMLDVEI